MISYPMPVTTRLRRVMQHGAGACLLSLSLVSTLQNAPAHAGEPAKGDARRSYTFGLGVAVVDRGERYTDIDDDLLFAPLIHFDNRWIRVAGGDLDLKLPSAGPVEFSLAGRYQRDGYEADDAPILAGMEEREDSFWGGAAVKWTNGVVDLSAEWLVDAMSNSEGQQASLTAEHSFDLGSFQVTPRLVGRWMDDEYVDYYYGVRAVEALGNRPFYEGVSTTNVELGVRTSYSFGGKQRVFLDVAGETFGTGIEDSPLIDDPSRMRVAVGYMYMF